MAIAVFPLPTGPAMRMALPAIRPSSTILRMSPAALRADCWPTIPSAEGSASSCGVRPRPRMCECEPMRSTPVRSRSWEDVASGAAWSVTTSVFESERS